VTDTSRAEQTILVTAFEPFGGRNVNRSELVLEHIARAAAGPRGIRPGVQVLAKTLPVAFARISQALDRALACKPDGVILLGESGSAEELRLERVAVNRIDARLEDNDGVRPCAERVLEDGPAAYFSTLSLPGALDDVLRAGAPAALSSDCGLFVCNATYYLALHKLHSQGRDVPVVFLHLPVKARAMALRTATKGAMALIRHLLDHPLAAPRRPSRPRPPSRRVKAPAGGREA
jgi:pyroglutamyl-peptidase